MARLLLFWIPQGPAALRGADTERLACARVRSGHTALAQEGRPACSLPSSLPRFPSWSPTRQEGCGWSRGIQVGPLAGAWAGLGTWGSAGRVGPDRGVGAAAEKRDPGWGKGPRDLPTQPRMPGCPALSPAPRGSVCDHQEKALVKSEIAYWAEEGWATRSSRVRRTPRSVFW